MDFHFLISGFVLNQACLHRTQRPLADSGLVLLLSLPRVPLHVASCFHFPDCLFHFHSWTGGAGGISQKQKCFCWRSHSAQCPYLMTSPVCSSRGMGVGEGVWTQYWDFTMCFWELEVGLLSTKTSFHFFFSISAQYQNIIQMSSISLKPARFILKALINTIHTEAQCKLQEEDVEFCKITQKAKPGSKNSTVLRYDYNCRFNNTAIPCVSYMYLSHHVSMN